MIPATPFGRRRSAPSPASRSLRVGIVLLCVLGGAALFAAPSAAEPTVEEVTVADNESWIGLEAEHVVEIEASGIETGDGPATVTVSPSGWPDDALVGDPDVEVRTSGVALEGDVETDGTAVTFDVNDTGRSTIDLEANVTLTLEHPLESSFDGTDYAIDAAVEDADGSDQKSAAVSIKRLSYSVDGDERFPPDTEFVYHNQAVTVGNLEAGTGYTLYEFDPEEGTLGGPVKSVSPSGTTATIETGEGPVGPGWYLVYDGSDIVPTAENAFQVRTQELSATQADGTVDSTGEGAATSVRLDSPLRSTAFDVNVTSSALDGEELFDVFEGETSGTVERADGDRIVIRDVEAGESVPMTFEPVLAATYDFEFEATDTGAAANSTVSVEEREVDASFGSDLFRTAAGDVVVVDVSLQDTDEAYVMIGGDRATGEGALTNYFDVLHVEGGATIRINTRLLGTNVPSDEVYESEGAEVTSYLQEPDHEGFDGVTFEGSADDLSSFRSEIGITDLPRPLQPTRLRLVAGASGSVVVRDDGIPDFERPLARSNVLVEDTEGFGNVTTYVAPAGSASEFDGEDDLGELEGLLTQRRTVAKGDRVVFEIEASGISGLVSWLGDRLTPDGAGFDPAALSTLLAFPDGVALEAEQTAPGMNERATALDLGGATDGDVYLLHEPMASEGDRRSIERYYLVFDTRGTGAFDGEIEAGETYRFRFGYDATGETDWFGRVDHGAVDPNGAAPHFPYADAEAGNESETRLVTVEEPAVEYETADSQGRPVLKSAASATVSGRTNLAPGTEVSLQLVPEDRTDGDRTTIEDVEIGADGGFEFTHDLSALDTGEDLRVEFYVDQRLLDARDGVVVGADEPLVEYRVVDRAEAVTVASGGSLAAVPSWATVRNAGYIPGNRSVELVVDNRTVGTDRVELDGGETDAVAFGGDVGLEPGEYEYAITTGDDEATGVLTVTEPNGEQNDGAGERDGERSDGDGRSDDGTSGDGSESEDEGDDKDEDEREDGGVVGALAAIPVGSRHAIGGAVVVGAVHVLGHWG